MVTKKELHNFIKALIQQVEYFEDNYPDNPNLDKLKRIVSENISEEGEIHISSSLQSLKEVDIFLVNCTDYQNRFEEENLYN
jgi:hypothetical protein